MTEINDRLVAEAIDEYGRLYSLPQNPLAVADIEDAMGTVERRMGVTMDEATRIFDKAVELGLIENVEGIIQLKTPRYR